MQTANLTERNSREAAPPCPATAAARTCLPLLRPADPLLPHLPPPVALLKTPSPLPQTTPRLPLLLLLRPALVLLPLPTIFEFPLSLYLLPLLSPFSPPSPSVSLYPPILTLKQVAPAALPAFFFSFFRSCACVPEARFLSPHCPFPLSSPSFIINSGTCLRAARVTPLKNECNTVTGVRRVRSHTARRMLAR